jgi:sigma-E factor negative regulatory protein RseA
MTEECDSQLSAMFDGELPAAECELLARRLTRDEALRAQWSRFSIIGAALRAERGVALHDRVAWRVQSAIAQEPTYGEGVPLDGNTRTESAAASGASRNRRWARFAWPTAGASIAAGVAAVSIFWLRGIQEPVELQQAGITAPQTIVLTPEPAGTTVAMNSAPAAEPPRSTGEPGVYSTPAPSSSTNMVPPARLANYVVAHSEYSGPLSRRMALLGIVGAEGGDASAPAPETAEEDDAN